MAVHSLLFASALALAPLGNAHSDELRPLGAESIDLGGMSGIAYYTVEAD
jgi:hypothetical protein